jgi:hypothetical protein
MTVAAVMLWGARIGAVSIDADGRYATFQYDPAFVRSGIEIAPVRMPVRAQPYSFLRKDPALHVELCHLRRPCQSSSRPATTNRAIDSSPGLIPRTSTRPD